jgi:hypothetical protein
LPEPVCEEVRGDPGQGVAQIRVTGVPGEKLSDDQERPAVADDVERPGECAELAVGTHAEIISALDKEKLAL